MSGNVIESQTGDLRETRSHAISDAQRCTSDECAPTGQRVPDSLRKPRPAPTGIAALIPQWMTRDEIADLVRRARFNGLIAGMAGARKQAEEARIRCLRRLEANRG